MADHIKNREAMLRFLREELVGPSPYGPELDCTQPVSFTENERYYGPFCQQGSGEELLVRDSPCQRYGVGVLYPLGTKAEQSEQPDVNQAQPSPVVEDAPEQVLSATAAEALSEMEDRAELTADDEPAALTAESDHWMPDTESDDFDLSPANLMKPSSMGISFLAEFPPGSTLVVELPQTHPQHQWSVNGRYRPLTIHVEGRPRNWWLRTPITLRAEFSGDAIAAAGSKRLAVARTSDNLGPLDLRVEAFAREHGPGQHLVTVCLVNRRKREQAGQPDELCLFQAYFQVQVVTSDGQRHILPYPTSKYTRPDAEERSLALLYRKVQTFGVGHGCAANWEDAEGGRSGWVSAECLPTYETPSITANLLRVDGTPLEVPMAPLAGLVAGNDGFADVEEVVSGYERWIANRRKDLESLPHEYLEAGNSHLVECERAARRMRKGLTYLKQNSQALKAFQMANHAILLQQLRSGLPLRKLTVDVDSWREEFSASYQEPNPAATTRGKWRAFQIAFLLMSIPSVADPKDEDRRAVELIWFPTGGGKTEAYLGLAAFSMFLRRLKDPDDNGVEVLMRYTLRLLTAQQFQRASGLLCAMEHLRGQEATQLGDHKFSIGIWLGGDNTPNRRTKAITALRALQRDPEETNPFVLTRCPWCGAQIGPVTLKAKRKLPRNSDFVRGYEESGGTVVLKCSDRKCQFHAGLPVYVIDEDIYERRPTLVIGTVDKFATLAWNEQPRALFGRDREARPVCRPPGLIIQDELHLISGPLGSLVGLYETVIEELCTDRTGPEPVPPKLVCSTATIRRYADQIRALYAREEALLFPPPGLDASDSFFACYATKQDGSRARGRLYVGVHAPALGSMQTTQVRTLTALFQGPQPMAPAERDPWWTQLIFFNSLRELGTTLTLFQTDIPYQLKVLRNRMGLDDSRLRTLRNPLELTSRLKSHEVPEAISALEVTTEQKGATPVDVCLASNIIEVGVDIDRLSLMAIVGQPKTTAQYIQVSGRVGRRWDPPGDERPGLVVTMYAGAKPRDRSHFEKFRSYHEQLYAQVEPTSVTPFSPPVLDRALHAIMVAYARQIADLDGPYPVPVNLLQQLRTIVLQRVQAVDPDELENFKRVFQKRLSEWRDRSPSRWRGDGAEPGLLRDASAHIESEAARLAWATPNSMRNVDAQCKTRITKLYVGRGGDDNA